MRAERQESAAAAEASLKDKEWITDKIKQYEPRVFYFDIIECLRKLAVAGLSAFFPPGSFEKLAFGVIVTTFFLGITLRLCPCAARAGRQQAAAARGFRRPFPGANKHGSLCCRKPGARCAAGGGTGTCWCARGGRCLCHAHWRRRSDSSLLGRRLRGRGLLLRHRDGGLEK